MSCKCFSGVVRVYGTGQKKYKTPRKEQIKYVVCLYRVSINPLYRDFCTVFDSLFIAQNNTKKSHIIYAQNTKKFNTFYNSIKKLMVSKNVTAPPNLCAKLI